jgi:hypothetical protein
MLRDDFRKWLGGSCVNDARGKQVQILDPDGAIELFEPAALRWLYD